MEFPSELVDVHREGRLVLFVGAGASKDAPASLPDFLGLTLSVADQARYPVDEAGLLSPDVVLGRIQDGGVDVHRCVADLLSSPTSTYNRLHEAIIELALTGPEIRIVTTNFDRHLTSALDARAVEVDEYVAPALPIGNDFTGVVYLHGTLSQPPARLVVTNDDFGNAYLRHAWAARFLERMFAEFSVLFIGYSHSDVVMRYLARALGPDGHRFVLTSTPEDPDWAHLGLRPIGYTVTGSSHAALGDAVGRWAEIAGMGLLDHRRRVSELVAVPPSGIPEDDSYLEELIADPERVGLFTEFARLPAWLNWASNQPALTKLLTRGSQPAETDRVLANWFAEHFIAEKEHTGPALTVVGANGGYLGPDLCNAIGRQLHTAGTPRPSWLGFWLVMLIRDAPDSDVFWLEQALLASRWPEDREQVLLLFDHLSEPVAGLTTSYLPGPPPFGIHARGSEHSLAEAWSDILKPNLPNAAHAVIAMADRHLRRTRDLQVAAHPENPDWDSASFRRSAIEPHPQDRYPEPIDVLIDAARDSIQSLLDSADPIATGYLHAWERADSQLLRRLAVHGWTHRTDVDSSAKIQWLVDTGWVADHRVRHEVFRLISAAVPEASDEVIEQLVANVLPSGDEEPEASEELIEQPEDDQPDHAAYARFSALGWIDKYRPNHPLISAALAGAHAVNPSWQLRTDPDLTHSIEVGTVPSRPPMSIVDFLEHIETDPSNLVTSLAQSKEVRFWEGRPTWEDALSLISSAVAEEPRAGFRLLEIDPPEPDVTRAVLNGWSRGSLDDETAEDILECIAALDLAGFVLDVARLLSDGNRLEGHPTDWTAYDPARSLALQLWDLVSDDEVVLGEIDWLSHATDQPGGNLAEFWLYAIHRDWRADEETWSGLTDEHRKALESMLDGPPTATRTLVAQVILVSRLQFLFAADLNWTAQHVIPLLDWSDPVRAKRCWNSFTGQGRWNDRILDTGLMGHYLQTAKHIEDFDSDHRRRVLGHLAGIALASERNPFDWLPDVIVGLSDANRARFADEITWILDDLPSEAVEHQWSRWMHTYWADRLRSVPTKLSLNETTAMAGWVPFLTDSFQAGVELVLQQPAGLRAHDDVLRHLDRHVDGQPDACARLIGHLLRSTDKSWWGAHELQRLMPRLRSGSAPEHLDAIAEEAIRLGLGDPGTWQPPAGEG